MHDSNVASEPDSAANTDTVVFSRVRALAVRSADWPRTFNLDALQHFVRIPVAGSAVPHMRALAQPGIARRAEFPPGAIEAIFGDIGSSHHSFRHPNLDWLRLTEPMATQALAKLLEQGEESMRNERLHAFLKALDTPDLPENPQDYSGFKVMAERDRVDLEVWLPIRDSATSRKWRPILVEAKFGHKLTRGQLSVYLSKRKAKSALDMSQAHCVLLALSSDAKAGLHHKQKDMWTFVSWRDLWLKFETLRPKENSPDLAIFLHSLWQRIGGLSLQDAR